MGQSVESAGQIRPFGALVPGAMGQVDTRYREWEFVIGCQNWLCSLGNQWGRVKLGGCKTPMNVPSHLLGFCSEAYNHC